MPEFRPSDEAPEKRGEVIAFRPPKVTPVESPSTKSPAPAPAQPTQTQRESKLEQLRASIRSAEQAPEVDDVEQPKSAPALAVFPGVSGDPGLLDAAQDALIRALGRAPKSEKEARDFLDEAFDDLGELETERILERCRTLGYLDDQRLAEQLRDGKFQRKALGRQAMSLELRKRGIASDAIDEVLSELDADDEYEQALELARERLRRSRGLDEQTAYRRIHGYLARRGYNTAMASRAVREALDE